MEGEQNIESVAHEVKTEWGLMLDCEKNGCDPKHSDDRRVFLHDKGMGTPTTVPEKAWPINRHATRVVMRRILIEPWVVQNDG